MAAAKAACPEALLFFRVGGFYEAFARDAQILARTLGLAITNRQGMAAAGFPHHQVEASVEKLVAAGHRAALCDAVNEARPLLPKLDCGPPRRAGPITVHKQ